MGLSGSSTMLQCARTLTAGTGPRGPAPPPVPPGPPAPPGAGRGVAVCVASASTFSGKLATRSTYERLGSIMPFDDWNSGTDVVYSGVTSITAALSGPYASTGKIATTAGLLDACTDLYTESDESAVMSKFVRRRITRFPDRSQRSVRSMNSSPP